MEQRRHDPGELDPRLVSEYANEPDVLRGMVGAANVVRQNTGRQPIQIPGITDAPRAETPPLTPPADQQ